MNEYYCAFDNKWSTNPAIGYGSWKIFNKDLLYRIKKMTDEEVKDLCGVKPDMFIEDDELMESMKDWGKPTYAKDEGEVPFTLEGLAKIWKAIYKEKKLKKEKRERMDILVLKNPYTKKKRQYKVQTGSFEVGDFILLDCQGWEVIKIVKRQIAPVTLIMRSEETGKYFKIRSDDKFNWKAYEKFFREKVLQAKVGDIVPVTDNRTSKVENYKIEKVLESKEREIKEKRKGPLDYIRRPYPFDLSDWMRYGFGAKKNIFPKGAVFSELSTGFGDNIFYKKYLDRVKRCKERSKLIHIIDKKAKKKELSEFHHRPYLKVVLEEVKGKPRGKENLDKIGFPCFCSFKSFDIEHIGQINIGWDVKTQRDVYEIFCIDQQHFGGSINRWGSYYSLKELMDKYEVEILKAEVKVWKEVGEYTK